MEYLFVSMAFLAGVAIGIMLKKAPRKHAEDTVTLNLDTFLYLQERDDELWQLEKSERSRIRYIAPQLKQEKAGSQTCLN